MPSSVWVGGIRMSVSTTSGCSSSHAWRSESWSATAATISTVGVDGEQLVHAFAHDQAVLSERDADGHELNLIPIARACRAACGQVWCVPPREGWRMPYRAPAGADRTPVGLARTLARPPRSLER